MKDYYNTLGVNAKASPDEIKSAYKKLAKQYHPDLNKNPGSEAKFKDINEAYDILSDQEKRNMVDHGIDPNNPNVNMGNRGGPFASGSPFGDFNDFSDVFRDFEFIFRSGNSPFGFKQTDDGSAFYRQTGRRINPNNDIETNYRVTLEEIYTGKEAEMSYVIGTGIVKKIKFTIPPGIENGTRIRCKGMGEVKDPNYPPGDLFVIINVQQHSLYQRQGPNLLMELNVDALDAITGTTIDIKTIDGTMINIKIPQAVQPNQLLRINGKGLKVSRNNQLRGDLIVRINIIVPKIDQSLIDSVEALKTKSRNYNKR